MYFHKQYIKVLRASILRGSSSGNFYIN